jgi:putative serine protease PepD
MNERENEMMNRKMEDGAQSDSFNEKAMDKKADPEATEELNMTWGHEDPAAEQSPGSEYDSAADEAVTAPYASSLEYDSPEDEEEEEIEYDEDEDETSTDQQKGLGMPKVIGLMVGTAVVSALVTSLLVPYLYGSTPQDVFSGSGNAVSAAFETTRETQASAVPKIIKVKGDGTLNPVAAVAQKLQPSVVNIKTTQPQEYMFHETAKLAGTGSGVIYTKDGYILTNNHVIDGATDIIVTIGKQEVKAKLIAKDPETDLAIIKVDKTGLIPAEFGNTSDIQVGDITVAIGSPFGLEHTVTSGIISAKNRTVSVPNEATGGVITYVNLIQTDASINPGNSGGALSDSDGKVIGINSLIASSSGTSDGVGFAIPSELAQKVADQLIGGGKASHAYIGVTGHDMSDIFAGGNKAAVGYGAQVVDVIGGSPADKAGLKQDDIIIAADGQLVNNMDDLISAIRAKNVGDTLNVEFYRGKAKMSAGLVLAEKPAEIKK